MEDAAPTMADMRVLVSGGAGYIGSHTVLSLLDHGHEVVVVDDFSNSKPTVIGRLEELSGKHVPVHAFDLTDADKTAHLFASVQIDAVIHFAGLKAVGESVAKPLEYYATNLDSTFSLLKAMRQHGVRKLVFSSSATVYGDNAPVPYREDYEPLSASSPYGRSKVMIEHVISDVAAAEDLKVAMLRYFNPVGAHSSGTIGEDPQGIPNNLMPFIAQVAVGRRDKLQVFGDDYPTADGTCIRDYVHVVDLADAHLAALDYLDRDDRPHDVFNVGTGTGASVTQVLDQVARTTGLEVAPTVGPRRPGDPAALVADVSRIGEALQWRAEHDLEAIVDSAWQAWPR